MVANASEVSGVLTASAGFVGLPVGPAEVEPGDIAGGTEIAGVSSEPPSMSCSEGGGLCVE